MEEPTAKRIRKTSTGFENNTVESYENPMDSNIYLNYDILRIVFRYLNVKELERAAMVCRFWLKAANHEKYTRGPDCFIEHHLHFTDKTRFIEKSRIKPTIGFFFIPYKTLYGIHELIIKILPSNCSAVMLYTFGTIINERLELSDDTRVDDTEFRNIVCALLPEIADVKINSLILCTEYKQPGSLLVPSELLLEFQNHVRKLIDMIKETPIPNQDESTCFIYLCNDLCNEFIHLSKPLLKAVQEYSGIDRITSVWGGVMKWPLSTACFRVVLITGSIQSWSVVVDGRYTTEEQVTKKLRLFKNQVKLKKHSVGFIFSCLDRKNVLEKPDSTIFKTLFPEVSLVGCFDDKAVGKNTMDHEMGSRRDWEIDEQTTTFMLLTYG
ncbi:uncharacterized protein LOC115234776 isoform X2 [Formica exsecta]|uniref:uncharacterized protein LOC115234776 isoform X2 n=1 Tax=Formica exsecta TaxID=72781 RepID=UPI0011431E50|nr:uncharacterized protein LOC115234776 isoform X2 [Formica exsecta]